MIASSVNPERLYLLRLGTTSVPLPKGTLEMVSASYLIQVSDGRQILIDTGLPADYEQPGALPSENVSSVIDQLALLSLQPKDIDLLICTHFDVDHAGYNDAFPQAKLIVQRAHYELARKGHPRFALARSHWDAPNLHYRLVDGDTELLPGIRLIETSGHAPAHQSVLVRLPRTGPVLLAIDAVVMERLFTVERSAWPTDDNEAQLRASTQKLLDVVAREQVRLVVFGHDGNQWERLKIAPEFYD